MTVESIVETVASVAPEIRAGLPGRRTDAAETGAEDTGTRENPTGDRQLAADVYADELLAAELLAIDSVASYASEEREDVTWADDGHGEGGGKSRSETGSETGNGEDGRYHLAVDPLDGSSNLRSNNPMGTIVGIYDEPLPASGAALVASGVVLFGPITTMTVAREGTVTEYVVDGGEPVAAREGLRLPEDPTVYGFGGRVPDWPDDFRSYAREIESELKLRYGGAMIADVNQVLTYGGVFAYPGLISRPEGKLRHQFEAAPIAGVIEAAGGASSDGDRSLLAAAPEDLHARTPVHVGNEGLIDRLEAALE